MSETRDQQRRFYSFLPGASALFHSLPYLDSPGISIARHSIHCSTKERRQYLLWSMGSARRPVFPLIPQPMALITETVTSDGPSRPRPIPPDKTTKPNRWRAPIDSNVLSRLCTIPLLALQWVIYGATPLYYLLHYSPFRDEGDGIWVGLLSQFVRWTLCVVIQYITAVLVVSWSGRYEVRKSRAVFALMVAGLFVLSSLKVWVDDDVGVSMG